jgi:GT2 family glycosyltransferase
MLSFQSSILTQRDRSIFANRMHKLSIIIVSYNVTYFLEQCLISVLKACKNIDAEIWVVDNHSADNSVRMVQEKFPQVKLVANKDNLGFSVANNQAIKSSNSEYVLLLNPDTVVQEDTFEKCLAYMDANPEAGALGVKMIDGNGQFLPESKRGLPTPEVALYKMAGLNKLFPKSRRFGKYHLSYLSENDIHEVDVLAGAYMLLRNTVLEEIGLLDETFFMYGEDIDLSYRVTKAGFKNIYFPDTSIIHYKGESTKRMSVNYVLIFYKAMIIFADKHYTGRNARMLKFFISTAIYLRALAALIQRFIKKYAMLILDTLLLVLGMLFLIDYWEEHVIHDTYPRALYTIHIPYYVALWVGTTLISGGYQKPYSIKRLWRGILVSTILIAAIYGVLPNDLRFSRALFILGGVWAAVVMLVTRLLDHYRVHKNLDLGSSQSSRTVIVGNQKECLRVKNLLPSSIMNFLGFVGVNAWQDKDYLGHFDRLDELVEIYNVQEVIFCSADVSSKSIIAWMKKIGTSKVNFKTVPDESRFIIGSNSKNTNGEWFTEEVVFNLNEPYVQRSKRLFDVLMSVVFLLFFPVLFILRTRSFKTIARNIFQVIVGKKTWVGYTSSQEMKHLPKLQSPVLSLSQIYPDKELDRETVSRLNLLYAKTYTVDQDLDALINFLRKNET